MVTLTNDLLLAELQRRSAPSGGVSPDVVERLAVDGPWEGRLWNVLEIFGDDWERMVYLAGGRMPEEVATWVGFWADADLTLDQIRLVISAGGYDPDPFVALARRGRLEQVLTDDAGAIRRVDGELVGAWISDQFPEATDAEILAWVENGEPSITGPHD